MTAAVLPSCRTRLLSILKPESTGRARGNDAIVNECHLMQKSLRSLVLCSCLLILYGATGCRLHPAGTVASQKQARAAIDQMIEALGGQAYLQVEDWKCKGKYEDFRQGKPLGDIGYYRFWKWPTKERFQYAKLSDEVFIYTEDAVYKATFGGAMQFDTSLSPYWKFEVQRRQYGLERVLREWLDQPGTAFTYEGDTIAGYHIVKKLKIINAQNDSVTFFINYFTHLPEKKTFMVQDGKQQDEISEIYSDWRRVQGIMTPFRVLLTKNGQPQRQDSIESISYNQHLGDEIVTPRPIVIVHTEE